MVGVVVVGCRVGGHIVVRLQGGQLMHLKCGECKERLLGGGKGRGGADEKCQRSKSEAKHRQG